MPKTRLFVAFLLAVCLGPGADRFASASESEAWVKSKLEELVQLYRHLHEHPELSLAERETAARLAAELKHAGAQVTTDFGGHGVVGILENGDGPCLMIRTDMDALPVVEETGLVFASKVRIRDAAGAEVGVMHACGHDIHMTCLVGVARFLAEHKRLWRGTVMFACQPAEERVSGAIAMLKDGLFEKFRKPDFALALHVDSTLEAGKVGFRAGYALANTDSVDITIKGRGGHGAAPHTTVDPIVQAARLILDLQTIVSREVDPVQPSVITVGSIHAGTKHNIIGDDCRLQLTVRSYKPEVRAQLLDAIRRKAKAAAASSGGPDPVIEVTDGTPAMFNDESLVARLTPIFRAELGDDNVVPSDPSMGGEDFSQYGLAGAPIFMFRLGAVDAQRLAGYRRFGPEPSLHSALFYPDAEPTITTGTRTMAAAALELLAPDAERATAAEKSSIENPGASKPSGEKRSAKDADSEKPTGKKPPLP